MVDQQIIVNAKRIEALEKRLAILEAPLVHVELNDDRITIVRDICGEEVKESFGLVLPKGDR